MAKPPKSRKRRPDRDPGRIRRRLPLAGSRLGRLILGLNLLGLAVLVAGALVLNEMGRGLVSARIDGLMTQGELIANVVALGATRGSPEPELEAGPAAELLLAARIPRSQRARLFDADGALIADSELIADRVDAVPLPPARRRADQPPPRFSGETETARINEALAALTAEVQVALAGEPVSAMRRSETGERLVSVSIPIQHVQAVVGVLTLEARDVDEVIAAQRRALIPFILVAVAVILGSSILLNWLIAHPILRLARAADSVRLSRARAISLPEIADRDDEVGDLAQSLEAMTSTLSARLDAIERFAADVAHEIKNPLTSVRSAVETLELAPNKAAQDRLVAILKQDVGRMDRLITDISNASRLDAELSRETPRSVDLGAMLADIVALYATRAGEAEAGVTVAMAPGAPGPFLVVGREGPLGQVFRNLIDNARSFSPEGGTVTVRLVHERTGGRREVAVTVEDEGPGIPAENLETVFERFYTARPKGRAFGGHSGLGLSIARQIVEAHGGRIVAENRDGAHGGVGGARFTVLLPEPPL
jgi:two-component system sensor histidine kinase ChvG